MELFAVVQAIFNKSDWKRVPEEDKYRYFFMVTRVLSIGYPTEINNCQVIGLGKKNSAIMLDCWNEVLSKRHTRPPQWLYIKSGTKTKDVDHLKDLDKELLNAYCNHHKLSNKDFDFILNMYGSELRKELLQFKKALAQLN